MRNRAKCKLCGDILESFTRDDYVLCSCEEIGIWGGEYGYYTHASNYTNFLRIDDNDREIAVHYKEEEDKSAPHAESKKQILTQELLYSLEASIRSIESLPDHAKYSSVTHADLLSLMIAIHELFKRIIPNESSSL